MKNAASQMGPEIFRQTMPRITLIGTDGETVDLGDPSHDDFVLFIYPRTGRPDEQEDHDWALIPGAKGCTAESCAFRDLAADYRQIGYSIYGLSSQDTDYQREAALRLHLTFPLLSDPGFLVASALDLPTFEYQGARLYTRSTLVVRNGEITHSVLGITNAAAHPSGLLDMLSGTGTSER